MGPLTPSPLTLPFQELPGAISARALAEHYKLYLSYREMLDRVDQGLGTVALPEKTQAESPLSALLWGQGYALQGVLLHELFFSTLTDVTTRIMILIGIEGLIERLWGSQEAFRLDMVAAGLQARGWVVLGASEKNPDDLRIFTLDSHDMGAVWGYRPLLVVDCYEHSYWMDFGADKKSYLESILGYVDWFTVDARHQELHGRTG